MLYMFDISARNNSTGGIFLQQTQLKIKTPNEGKELRKYNKRFKEKSFTIRL